MKAVRHLVLILVLAGAGCGNKVPDSVKKNQCNNNLWAIRLAKEEWARLDHITTNATPVKRDLAPWIIGGVPKCPSGGIYTLGPVGTNPRCSIHGHEIPPARATPIISNYGSSSAMNQLPPFNPH